MSDRGQQIIESLEGTCKSLSEAATEAEQNDAALCQEIDDAIFECGTCGWWCEDSENNGAGVCVECEPNEDN